MLSPGSSVDAIVESVKAYGVYLLNEDDRILVLAVETADTAQQCRHKMANFAIGEIVTVRILRFVAEETIYVGTMKST